MDTRKGGFRLEVIVRNGCKGKDGRGGAGFMLMGSERLHGYCERWWWWGVWEREGEEWKVLTNLTTQGYECVHDMNQAVRDMRLQSVTK